MIIVDAGACKGDSFRRFVLPGNIIYAFEPYSYNYNGLIKEFTQSNVHVIKAALSNYESLDGIIYDNGRERFYGYYGASLYSDVKSISSAYKETCRVMKLSSYYNESIKQLVDVLVLNIEGAEYDVLEDLIENGVVNNFKTMYIEDHSACSSTCRRRRDEIWPKFLSVFTGKLYIWEWYQEGIAIGEVK